MSITVELPEEEAEQHRESTSRACLLAERYQ
jgi:hypothetical protein